MNRILNEAFGKAKEQRASSERPQHWQWVLILEPKSPAHEEQMVGILPSVKGLEPGVSSEAQLSEAQSLHTS